MTSYFLRTTGIFLNKKYFCSVFKKEKKKLFKLYIKTIQDQLKTN